MIHYESDPKQGWILVLSLINGSACPIWFVEKFKDKQEESLAEFEISLTSSTSLQQAESFAHFDKFATINTFF